MLRIIALGPTFSMGRGCKDLLTATHKMATTIYASGRHTQWGPRSCEEHNAHFCALVIALMSSQHVPPKLRPPNKAGCLTTLYKAKSFITEIAGAAINFLQGQFIVLQYVPPVYMECTSFPLPPYLRFKFYCLRQGTSKRGEGQPFLSC